MWKVLKICSYCLLTCLLLPIQVVGQASDLAAVHPGTDQTVYQLLFANTSNSFSKMDAFSARTADLAELHPHLTVSGDFTGDGQDEIVFFEDLLYTPNLQPDYTRSVLRIMRSMGDHFLPYGTWFSAPDTSLGFEHVDLAVAEDFNQDGLCDIALFYNDPASDQLDIYILESGGSEFSQTGSWYSCERTDFNFTALKFACPGDFNGNGKPDIAVFYNYFGTAPETKQSIFLFESDGDSFDLLPVAYESTKAQIDFSDMQFAASGGFNPDSYTDLAVLMKNPSGTQTQVPVFEGSASGQLIPLTYYDVPVSALDAGDVNHMVSLDFSGDEASELALFHDNPGNGSQEILVMESEGNSFKEPEIGFVTDPGNFLVGELSSVVAGNFSYQAVVKATTWKENRQGAISFTFDDGYEGAFLHGGAELDAAGLRGTFFIFTDTTLSYDGEIAGTSLVREYKDRGHEIGSHSSNHSDLGGLFANGDHDSLSRVLSESVALLNERFDQETISLSIPFGSFTQGSLDSLSNHFLSARSSQHGLNLATPYDLFALRSWPILSTTSPAFVDDLVAQGEKHGHYLPLMYHDLVDEPFDEALEIYTYGRDKFRQTLQLLVQRNVWIDTHQNIYKYLRMRNALKIEQLDLGGAQSQPAYFSFVADDALSDSLFNIPLTLLIRIPDSWTEDSVTVESEDLHIVKEVLTDEKGAYIYFNQVPSADRTIHVHEGRKHPSSIEDRQALVSQVKLEAFPNPFRHETRIRVSGQRVHNGILVLMDLQGRKIREFPLLSHEPYQWLREELSPGVYLVQLIDSGVHKASLRLFVQ